MTVDRLTAGLERVRRTGPGRWVARCPAHKDRTASLSIRELDDGRTLVHCFAGCAAADVVAAAGVTMEDLFPPRPSTPGGGRPAEPRPFSARELLDALARELGVAWVLLADLAAGREIVPKDRKRAAVARDRCMALLEELRHAR
jgi:hypothetical protein